MPRRLTEPPPVGTRIQALRSLGRTQGQVPRGTYGVVHRHDNTGHLWVQYDNGVQCAHDPRYKGDTWDIASDQRPGTITISVEQQRILDMFVSSSTEVIEGVVPQIKYGDDIIWQGTPVATTDDDGHDLAKGQQHDAALKAAQAKTKEVVKGLFA